MSDVGIEDPIQDLLKSCASGEVAGFVDSLLVGWLTSNGEAGPNNPET